MRALTGWTLAVVGLAGLAAGCGSSGAAAGGDAGHESDGTSSPPPSEAGGKGMDGGATKGGKDAAGTPEGSADKEAGTFWTPSSATPVHYHWQLSTVFSYPRDVVTSDGPTVYDIDGQENDAATVASLHAIGPDVKVVCYVDVGTWENERPDAKDFPTSVLGNNNGWPGEKWLDVRQQSILLPLMKARFQSWCIDKGFDAVEPDNLDAWENNPGFPITEAENISYDLAIAALGHSMGLSMGLKNLPENAPSLEPNFDWALDEQCFQYSECSYFETSFIAKGKSVWDVEYDQSPNCTSATAAKLNAQKRDLNLVGPKATGYVYAPCVADTMTTW
jgi:hypothetical protein